jgi:hypothetical protein
MAVPRKRKSSRRRGNQRSHDALKSPNYNACANFGRVSPTSNLLSPAFSSLRSPPQNLRATSLGARVS